VNPRQICDVVAHLDCMHRALVSSGVYLVDMAFGTDGSPESDVDEWNPPEQFESLIERTPFEILGCYEEFGQTGDTSLFSDALSGRLPEAGRAIVVLSAARYTPGP
jgi:hypothetical protein